MRVVLGLGGGALVLLVTLAVLFTRFDAEASGPDQAAYRGSEPPA